jgi:hypothetical protein
MYIYVVTVATLMLFLAVLRIRITLMRIRILPFTLMRIRILSFNWMRIRIRIRILPPTFSQTWTLHCFKMSLKGLPPCHFDVDPDPAFHFDANRDPASQNDADPDTASQNYAVPDPQHCFFVNKSYLCEQLAQVMVLRLGIF